MTYLAIRSVASQRWPWIELRRLARNRRLPNTHSDRTLLSVSAAHGVRARPEDGGRQLPSESTVANYWQVEPDDLVFNPMWALEGGVAVSDLSGAVSTAYRVYELGPRLHPRFAHHFSRSTTALDQYKLMVRGVTTFDRSINREDFEAMPFPVPPMEGQRAIADYLDTETARIDGLITRKRRLIDLLEERLSRRLDHLLGVGTTTQVDWVKLRYVTQVSGGLTLGKSYEGTTIQRPYLRVANVQDRRLDLEEVVEIKVPPPVATRFELRYGDVLMLEGNGSPENLGRGTLWRDEIPGCLHQNHVHAVRSDPSRLDPEYLDAVVRTDWARRKFTGESAQVSIATLSQAQIGDLAIPLPSLSTQRVTVARCREERERAAELLQALQRQVDLLVEHRQALITAAVTGELTVPGVAA